MQLDLRRKIGKKGCGQGEERKRSLKICKATQNPTNRETREEAAFFSLQVSNRPYSGLGREWGNGDGRKTMSKINKEGERGYAGNGRQVEKGSGENDGIYSVLLNGLDFCAIP